LVSASSDVTVELIRLIPPLLWAGTILAVVLIFRRSIRERLLPRLEGFEAFGLKATFVRDELDRAAEAVPVGGSQERTQVARRAERLAPLLNGARALLVNDFPDEMEHVVSILEGLGVSVTTVTSTDEALGALERRDFDVVISDMKRGDNEAEGVRFLELSIDRGLGRPTILTVGRYEPERGTPAFAFGITNRVDELLNLLFDALERSRG
jgi:CheY-like chemotaxis protein